MEESKSITMRLRGAYNEVFDIQLSNDRLYDVFRNGKRVLRGVTAIELYQKFKRIDTLDYVIIQRDNDIKFYEVK